MSYRDILSKVPLKTVYVVLLQERHINPEVEVFIAQNDAHEWAYDLANKYDPDWERIELTGAMKSAGWTLCLTFGESDSVTVYKAKLRNEL